MFYKIIRPIARFVVWVLNGHLHVHHKDRLPKGNYVLVAPHRTWWEPILFALAASPMEFMFMAKKELFKLYKRIQGPCDFINSYGAFNAVRILKKS